MNRGIVDIFGYAVPSVINANNNDEARERVLASVTYFSIAFLSPLVMMPLFNRFFLKKAGIIDKFSDKGVEIVRLSKKYLVKDSKTMMNGLNSMVSDLKNNPSEKISNKFKNIDKDLAPILDKFADKEILRNKLLKTHTKIAIADYISTGAMLLTASFGIRELTKKLTGRTGFSAEYKMADDDYTKKNAQKHEQNKKIKILSAASIAAIGSVVANLLIQKSFMKSNPKGLMQWIKNNAEKFNYTDGKYMKILPYFLITLVADAPAYLMSARDKYELRDSAARLTFCSIVFFGGDAFLSNVFGRIFDKTLKTKLVNKEGLDSGSGFWKKATAPIYSLEELQKKAGKIGWDDKILKRTQKFGIGMYWLNLALVTLMLGVGLPKTLNYILKKDVKKDLKQL